MATDSGNGKDGGKGLGEGQGPEGRGKDPRFLKYGGVEFELLTSPEAVNRFARGLPPESRSSLHSAAKELERAGPIRIPEGARFTTIDEDYPSWMDDDEYFHGWQEVADPPLEAAKTGGPISGEPIPPQPEAHVRRERAGLERRR